MSTIYKRKDGRWEERIYLSKGKYKAVYAVTREDIEKKLLEIQENTDTLNYKHSFEKLYTEWIQSIEVNVKESTACNYRMKAMTHLIPYFNKIRCSEISEHLIKEFITTKRSEKLSDRYISDMITLINENFRIFGTNYP